MAEEVIPGELDITDELIAERRAEEPGETPEDMTPWQRPITAFIDVHQSVGWTADLPAVGAIDCRDGF